LVIVVDTSIWVDHLRAFDPLLQGLISRNAIVQHPFVTGEIVVGNLQSRDKTLWALRSLPQIEAVNDNGFHAFLESAGLSGTGLGFVDVHILAAVNGHDKARIWTRDRRMHEQAERLGLAFLPAT
jgi:predicted nucleic acid-binding protein